MDIAKHQPINTLIHERAFRLLMALGVALVVAVGAVVSAATSFAQA